VPPVLAARPTAARPRWRVPKGEARGTRTGDLLGCDSCVRWPINVRNYPIRVTNVEDESRLARLRIGEATPFDTRPVERIAGYAFEELLATRFLRDAPMRVPGSIGPAEDRVGVARFGGEKAV
jgi:hypothetical protein